jgi:UTP--glucose-1-phosphate uridylyltransferase
MKSPRTAIFPVAGLGTRFLPATKAIPKEMLTVVDKPLIQYAVEEAAAAGIERFVFVTGRNKTEIEDHFDLAVELNETLRQRGKKEALESVTAMVRAAGDMLFVRQQEPRGLGHAVWCARHLVDDEPVAVLLPDDLILSATPCLQQMVQQHRQTGGNLVAVMDVPRDQTNRYGVIQPGKQSGKVTEVTGLVEKPKPDRAPSTLAVVGRYILSPEIFPLLEKQGAGAGGEIQLTDAMAKLIGREPFHGYRFDGERYDCGDRAGFLDANLAFALADPAFGATARDILEKHAAGLKRSATARSKAS